MPETRYKKARFVTLVGAAVNLLIAVAKVTFGILGHSHALVADGIHSFSDLLTDALVLFASRFGSRAADSDHPYGHQRIETMATVALALILILAGAGIMLDAGEHVFSPVQETPALYVLFIAILSVAANEFLYRYTLRAGKELSSALLQANAWHHRSDAASSMVVVLGVAGALLGFIYLDALAAVVVGIMVIKMGWSLGWSSIRELIDTAVEPSLSEEFKATILASPGVETIHQLRTRSMGEKILLDVHITVSPNLTVSEGHYIASQVHHKLRQQFKKIDDVTIHIDPENDEFAEPTRNLPAREQLLPELYQCWQEAQCPGSAQLKTIELHYLNGKIKVKIHLPISLVSVDLSADDIQQQYQLASARFHFIESVRISFFA